MEYSLEHTCVPVLESLFDKVAGPQDCCKTYLLHALLRFHFSLGKTLYIYVHRGVFRTKLNIYNGAFFTLVKPYFKNVLNSIALLLGSNFLHNSLFHEKTDNCENFGRKSLFLAMEQFFIEIRNYAMEWRHHKKMNKEGLLN